jgi:hypothetical protein
MKEKRFQRIYLDSKLREEILYIHSVYCEDLSSTFEIFNSIIKNLEKKISKSIINKEVYKSQLVNLYNMVMVYFFALYEGFIRITFQKIEISLTDMSEEQFKKEFRDLHVITKQLVREKYGIYIPYKDFSIIKKLKETRDNITHNNCYAFPDYHKIELCKEQIQRYFSTIMKRFQLI